MCTNCKKPYYISTAIAYTSGKPHIGNTYEIVLADAIARYKREQGYDVYFQTGTDEHGQKIELKAADAGVTPKEFVDNVAGQIKEIWDLMNTSYDKFIRTTDDYHEKQVQKIFKKLYDQGDIYKGHYEGLYCTPCQSFWTPSQVVDGKCPDCGRPVQPAKEEAYFFRMSKYAPKLIEYINEHPEFIQPVSRKNEMMNNFLLPGLQDLCVSRTSFKWGIPVTFDPKHVTYVWLDALTNYITGIGYDCDGNSDEKFKKYWPADLHLIGKDIIRFHTIYWPIFLMALGVELPKHGVVGTGIQDAEGEARLREVHGHRLHDGLGGVGKINGDDVAHAGSHLVHQAAGLAKVDILCPLADLCNGDGGDLFGHEAVVQDHADQHLKGGRGRNTAAFGHVGGDVHVQTRKCCAALTESFAFAAQQGSGGVLLLLAGGQVIKVDDAQVVPLALHAQLVQAVGGGSSNHINVHAACQHTAMLMVGVVAADLGAAGGTIQTGFGMGAEGGL